MVLLIELMKFQNVVSTNRDHYGVTDSTVEFQNVVSTNRDLYCVTDSTVEISECGNRKWRAFKMLLIKLTKFQN